MASLDWPSAANLPQYLRLQGYAQANDGGVIRSPMGYGPAKLRRRTTAVVQRVSGSLTLTATEKDNLITFYDTTTEGGVLPFNWFDFLNGLDSSPHDEVEYRFAAPPQYTTLGGGLWLASLLFEVLP